jgi:lipopolysaccharide transport system permease protein
VNAESALAARRTVRLQQTRTWFNFHFGELWHFRELVFFLTWRDIVIRYKQTAIGALWALLKPLFTMVVFTFVFSSLARIPSEGVPYPVFVFAGLLPWSLFVTAVTECSMCLVGNQSLITKVYFPRLVLPLATVLGSLVDFLIAFCLLLAIMASYGMAPRPAILAVPLFVVVVLLCALALGLWFSALNVRYRDVRYTVPFLTQVGLFVTPVAYPSSLIPEKWRLLYSLNPMAGVVDGFRWALLGNTDPPGLFCAVSLGMVLLLLLGGLAFFHRMEKTFADVI